MARKENEQLNGRKDGLPSNRRKNYGNGLTLNSCKEKVSGYSSRILKVLVFKWRFSISIPAPGNLLEKHNFSSHTRPAASEILEVWPSSLGDSGAHSSWGAAGLQH